MSNSPLQFKFLDAGAKSSPVVLDPSLSTSNEQTLYLYHQQRDQIIEYRRDIVETKLRDLTKGEQQQVKTLEQAFKTARGGFTPRGAAAEAIPEKAAPPKSVSPRNDIDDEEEGDDSDDMPLIDDDDLLDDDEDDTED